MNVPTMMTQVEMEICAKKVTLENIKVIMHKVMKIFMQLIQECIQILFESSMIFKRNILKLNLHGSFVAKKVKTRKIQIVV